MTVFPGARIKSKQEGRTLVLDVLDPLSRRRDASTAGSRPNPSKPAPVPEPHEANHSPNAPEPPGTPEPVPSAHEQAEAPQIPAEATAPAAEAPVTPRPVVHSVTMFAGPEVGAAAFRRGRLGMVIFDDPVTLADAEDGEPTLTPTLQAIQRGTLMTVPLAADETLALKRSGESVTLTVAPATGSPAVATTIPTGIQYQLTKPGRVMSVSDPVSGQTMLIGTSRQMDGEHALIDISRAAPGYVLLSTWLGVALETSSDRVDLRASTTGYTLAIADQAATNATASARQENQFSIPVAPASVLVRQLSAQIASAAAAPPRGRGPDRVAAAKTMLALGMSAESEALLNLAATDDPAVARDPNTAALSGVAAVLAGRPTEASGLDNPALPTGGDIALWRGLRDVGEGK